MIKCSNYPNSDEGDFSIYCPIWEYSPELQRDLAGDNDKPSLPSQVHNLQAWRPQLASICRRNEKFILTCGFSPDAGAPLVFSGVTLVADSGVTGGPGLRCGVGPGGARPPAASLSADHYKYYRL